MDNRDLLELIAKIIMKETKYFRVYDGEVVELLENGDVKVTVASLGWDTNDKAAICSLTDKNSLTALNISDIVKIGFTNGNPAQGYIIGVSNNYSDNSVQDYQSDNSIDVLYQNSDATMKLIFNKNSKEFNIIAGSGVKIKLENGAGNTVEIGDTSVKINGSNLEVLL